MVIIFIIRNLITCNLKFRRNKCLGFWFYDTADYKHMNDAMCGINNYLHQTRNFDTTYPNVGTTSTETLSCGCVLRHFFIDISGKFTF